MSKKPTVEIMTVTPQMAENWLTRNYDRNRKLRRSKVEQYAADIEAGRWHLSDQAISFDTNSNIVNGQHRLEGVLLAGKPILTLVMRNVPTESMLVLDGAMKRSTDDNFTVAGRDYPKQCGATVRRVLLGVRSYAGRAFTDQEVDGFMRQHSEAVRFSHHVLPGGRFGGASIRAPMVRAKIRRAAQKKLERFGEVLTTGMMVPGEEAAVLLRTFVFDLATTKHGRDRQQLYCKTEAALSAFLRGEPVKKLPPAKEELFPLPGEEDEPSVRLLDETA